MRLTPRGKVVLACLFMAASITFLIWADHLMSIPGVDDAVVDAELLQ